MNTILAAARTITTKQIVSYANNVKVITNYLAVYMYVCIYIDK